MDDSTRLHEVERATRENAIAVERAASDAKAARDAAAEFRPIVLARSGDEQRRDKFETNVDQAHDKIRLHNERIQRLEKWAERFAWIGIGLVIAGQVIWWVAKKILEGRV